MPLVARGCAKETRAVLAEQSAVDLFPQARFPEPALGGLWLYFSGADECHAIVQDLPGSETAFWHAILHRQEPDPGNAAYWFRATGSHPVFPQLAHAAQGVMELHSGVLFRPREKWDPFAFIDFCEQARRQPGSQSEQAALEIQRAEWQLLFDYCARSGS